MDFLSSYQELCDATGRDPLTVFISLTTVSSPSILSLLDSLDVVIPSRVRKRLLSSSDMGRESLRISTEVFHEIIDQAERSDVKVPMGLQIEQVGVHNGELSLSLLDSTYPTLKGA